MITLESVAGMTERFLGAEAARLTITG